MKNPPRRVLHDRRYGLFGKCDVEQFAEVLFVDHFQSLEELLLLPLKEFDNFSLHDSYLWCNLTQLGFVVEPQKGEAYCLPVFYERRVGREA
jgi:hypothetical protein